MNQLENSLASLEAALALGVDMYEDDVRITRDGALVLAHDDQIASKHGGSSSIAALSLQELRESAMAPITLLSSVLEEIRAAGIRMNLDIKSSHALAGVARLVEQMGMTDHVLLSGLKYEAAQLAAHVAPNLPRLLNVGLLRFVSLSYEKAVIKMCTACRAAGCFGLNIPHQFVRSELTESAWRKGLDVYVWTVAEEEDMRRLATLGVDAITTRNPAQLIAVREAMNKTPRSVVG
jgi:glycerophosphoryl diester phosphodiesterase